MKKIDMLNQLRSEGKFTELKTAICSTTEERRTLEENKLLGWALYRLGEYEASFELALKINDLELASQISAYVTKDDALIDEALETFPDNPTFWNARVIRARDPDFGRFCLKKFFQKDEEFANSEEIGAINFRNNLARLFLAKGDHYKDPWVALGLWNSVVIRYIHHGEGNVHHLAAVYFWMLQAYLKLGEKSLAIEMARQSAELWEIQSKRDPQNLEFQKKYENALKIYQGL